MGGGVAFFTANSVVVKRRLDLELAAVEFLWIEFRIRHLDILCGVCYRPPDNDSVSLDNFFEYFQLVLDKIRQLPKQYIIVMLGDFNAHYDVANPSGNSEVGGKLYSFLESNNLVQLIAEPTRVTSNSSTILDLVITNSPERFSASGTLSPASNCDHSVIFASMNLFTHRSRSHKRQVWNFNNVNSADLNCELSQMDWFSLCDNTNDIDETYSCWYSHFRSIIEKYIPLKTLQYVLMINLGWIVKCAMQLGGGTVCSEFIIHVHLRLLGKATGLNVTLFCNFVLYGVKSVNFDINCALFREVQRFIMSTNRFSMTTV